MRRSCLCVTVFVQSPLTKYPKAKVTVSQAAVSFHHRLAFWRAATTDGSVTGTPLPMVLDRYTLRM